MLDKKSENVLKISISKYDGDMDKDINIYDRNILEEKFNITTENIKKIKKTKLFN